MKPLALLVVVFALLASLVALLGGCASAPRAPVGGAPLVVGPEEALRLSSRRDVVVLDARTLKAFEESRLASARRVDVPEWMERAKSAEDGLGDAEAWRGPLADLGVRSNSRVLVYDGGGMTAAATVWFVLRNLGFNNVSVIDGGLPALRDQTPNVTLATGAATAPPFPTRGRPFEPRPVAAPVSLSTKDDVKAVVAAGSAGGSAGGPIVLDVRSNDEWAGTDTRDNPRVGRIPGAVHVPHTAFIGEDGRLVSRERARELLASAGVTPGRPVVVHCQGGGRAAFAAMVMVHAGFADVSNYLGSFGEWSRDDTCPIVSAQ